MELQALQAIATGVTSLSEIERTHPILGRKLHDFVETINRCCREAYTRFSRCLDGVLTLPTRPTKAEKEAVIDTLKGASDSKWFREVAKICDDLAALATQYDSDISAQIEYSAKGNSIPQVHSLNMLLAILHRHEGDLKSDIRRAVDRLKVQITESKLEDARQHALSIKGEIDAHLTQINVLCRHIAGSTRDGAERLLSREEIAERALKTPERVLILNGAFIIILLGAGAAVFQFLSVGAFVLLTGFILTAVIVMNAFYLTRECGVLGYFLAARDVRS